MNIHFTKHSLDKLEVLERHHVSITKAQVEEALAAPDTVDTSRSPLLFAEKAVTTTHNVRVVYKQENEMKMILTFYPIKQKHEPGT